MIRALKTIAAFLVLSVLYLILWNLGLSLATALLPYQVPEMAAPAAQVLALMLAASALNMAVVMVTIASSRWQGLKLAATVALQIYGIQFFMSQIETLWFNDALGLPLNLVYATLLGGLFAAVLAAVAAVLLMGKFKRKAPSLGPLASEDARSSKYGLMWRIAVLAVLVYPALYFLAGHFIAWQFPEVRALYGGPAQVPSFWTTLWGNVISGLWAWQILRGLLWIAIAWPVLRMTRGSRLWIGVVVGLLFAVLMNAQHLIPNPYMPGLIPLAHGIETASSNFVWGMAVAWLLAPRRAAAIGPGPA